MWMRIRLQPERPVEREPDGIARLEAARPRPTWWTIVAAVGPVDGVADRDRGPVGAADQPDIARLAAALGIEDRPVEHDPARVVDMGHPGLGGGRIGVVAEEKGRHRSGLDRNRRTLRMPEPPIKRRSRRPITSCGPLFRKQKPDKPLLIWMRQPSVYQAILRSGSEPDRIVRACR